MSTLPTITSLTIKSAITHTITYFLMGVIASRLLHYADMFARPENAPLMRQFSDPLLRAGPLFQPLRGVVFALAFYPVRAQLFGDRNGWLIIWWLLVALGILSTFGPAQGSIEGMIYTKIPISRQLTGWLEVVPQALLFSIALHYWCTHPEKRWLNWLMAALILPVLLLPTLGLFFR